MQQKTLIFLSRLSLLTFLLFLLILEGLWAYDKVLEPAYMSTVHMCGLKTTDEINEMGYSISATYNPNTDKIKIKIPASYNKTKYDIENYKKTSRYKRSLKHEICHRDQARDNRLNGCGLNHWGFPGARFFDEMECSFRSYF